MKQLITIMAMVLLIAGLARCAAAPAQAPTAPATPGQAPAAQEARVLGILDFQAEGTKDVLTAPDTVAAGADFDITITTVGGGCERAGDTAVLLAETSASVMVYDFTAATHPGVVCTAILKRLPHTASVRFDKPGEALIRVWGRRVGPETPPAGQPIVLEHRVMVQ
jgi:hypothetical protein